MHNHNIKPIRVKNQIQYKKESNLSTLLPKRKPDLFGDPEVICLAKNIFFEARGTKRDEMIRVAKVTTNRVKSNKFSNSYCDVVFSPYQFSWTKDYNDEKLFQILKKKKELHAWRKIKEIAEFEITYGFIDRTDGSLFYHTHKVNPKWNKKMNKVVSTNYHIYYNLSEKNNIN
jgi:spore germination cell wall hydrolase CwlJ-like protein